MANFKHGDIIDHYKIINKIGSGIRTDVYKIFDLKKNTTFALKVLPLEYSKDNEIISRFKHSSTKTSELIHSNVIKIHDAGVFKDNYYFITDYIAKISLNDIFSEDIALKVISRILNILDDAHNINYIHSSLYPQNILLTKKFTPILTDFYSFDPNARNKYIYNGNAHYLSPEHFLGKELTIKSDIYSLGIIIYEMMTKKLPFDKQIISLIMKQHCNETPLSPKKLNPNIPTFWENLILKMIAKDPKERFQTPHEIIEKINESQGFPNLYKEHRKTIKNISSPKELKRTLNSKSFNKNEKPKKVQISKFSEFGHKTKDLSITKFDEVKKMLKEVDYNEFIKRTEPIKTKPENEFIITDTNELDDNIIIKKEVITENNDDIIITNTNELDDDIIIEEKVITENNDNIITDTNELDDNIIDTTNNDISNKKKKKKIFYFKIAGISIISIILIFLASYGIFILKDYFKIKKSIKTSSIKKKHRNRKLNNILSKKNTIHKKTRKRITKKTPTKISKTSKQKENVITKPVKSTLNSYSLNINSRPSGAIVIINNIKKGKTPLKLNFKTKNINLKLVMKNRYPIKEKISFDNLKSIKRTYNLKPVETFLFIKSIPDNSKVYINGKIKGKTPLRTTIRSQNYKIELKKDGYISYSGILKVENKENFEKTYALKKSIGSINFSSTPDNAKIYINNKFIGSTPFIKNGMLPKSYKITFKKENYENINIATTVIPGKSIHCNVILHKNCFNITINSTPTNAKVYVDNNFKGKTPLKIKNINANKHKFTIVKEGYHKAERNIEIYKNDDLKIDLIQIVGELIIYTEPNGAEIYLDNKYIGTTPIIKDDIQVGKHSLLIKNNYASMKKEITIDSENSTEINIPIKVKKDNISINSYPQNASIFINNVFYGKTPLIIDLTPEKYSLTLKLNGYKDHNEEFYTGSNINVKMTPTNNDNNLWLAEINEIYDDYILLNKGSNNKIRKNIEYKIYNKNNKLIATCSVKKLSKNSATCKLKEKFADIKESMKIIKPELEYKLKLKKKNITFKFNTNDEVADLVNIYINKKLFIQTNINKTKKYDLKLIPGVYDVSIKLFKKQYEKTENNNSSVNYFNYKGIIYSFGKIMLVDKDIKLDIN